MVIDGHNVSLEVLSEGQILVDVSLYWWLSASSAALLGSGPLPVFFWIVVEPLAFSRVVFLTPTILFSILGFISHSTFWLFCHTGW